MEQANFLNYINKIDKKTAIYFLRRSFSMMDYNLRISREINFKKTDYTSIFKSRILNYILKDWMKKREIL